MYEMYIHLWAMSVMSEDEGPEDENAIWMAQMKAPVVLPAGSTLHWHWITPCEMHEMYGPGQ